MSKKSASQRYHPGVAITLTVSLYLALAVAGCASPANSAPPTFVVPSPPTPAPGSLIQVARGSITGTIFTRGRVASAHETTLSFPVRGALKTLAVQPGQQVKKGELLAELDAWDLETEVFNAQHDLEATQVKLAVVQAAAAARVEQAEADLVVVQAEADLVNTRWRFTFEDLGRKDDPHPGADLRRLYTQGDQEMALAAARVARAQAALESAKTAGDPYYSVAVARQDAERARARLQRAQDRLAVTKILAPFEGVIVSLSARVGDGLDAYQPIGVIADPSQLAVIANVFEDDLDNVFAGQPAEIKLDAYPDKTFVGKISQIASRAISWQGKNAYEVTIAFADAVVAPVSIRQGADVSIAGRNKSDVLLVPNRVVVRQGNQSYVEVIQGAVTARVAVQLGVSDGTRTEVIAGLKEGDTVKAP